MMFIVLFEDAEDAPPDLRKRHMANHLAFLKKNEAAILAAGPLSDADGTDQGGLWLVEAADEAAVDHFVKTDPFWPTGLRKSVRVLRWTRVFADGEALLAAGRGARLPTSSL